MHISSHYHLTFIQSILLSLSPYTVKSEASESRYEFRADLPELATCTGAQQEQLARQISRRAAELTESLHCLRDGTCTIQTPQISGCDTGVETGTARSREGGRRGRSRNRQRNRRSAEEDEDEGIMDDEEDGEYADVMEDKVHITVSITYHGDKGN